MARKRRRYSAEFKFRSALEAAKGLSTVNQLAGDHEIHPDQLCRSCCPASGGLLIGDKGYISWFPHQNLLNEGIDLRTSLRKNMHDERSRKYVSMLMSVRRRIETVIGQLTERFNIEKVRARDVWHLTSRTARKLLGHILSASS